LTTGDKTKLVANNKALDGILKKYNLPRSKYSNLNKDGLSARAIDIVDSYIEESTEQEKTIIADIITEFNEIANMNPMLSNNDIKNDVQKVNTNMKTITDYMSEVKSTLDKAVH
jgi:hypothetical protein